MLIDIFLVPRHKTQIAGKLFSKSMVVLFIKGPIKGLVNKFSMPENENPNADWLKFPWCFENILFGMVRR